MASTLQELNLQLNNEQGTPLENDFLFLTTLTSEWFDAKLAASEETGFTETSFYLDNQQYVLLTTTSGATLLVIPPGYTKGQTLKEQNVVLPFTSSFEVLKTESKKLYDAHLRWKNTHAATETTKPVQDKPEEPCAEVLAESYSQR